MAKDRSKEALALVVKNRTFWGKACRWLSKENGGETLAARAIGVTRTRLSQWAEDRAIPDNAGQASIIAGLEATEAKLATVAAEPGPLEERWKKAD